MSFVLSKPAFKGPGWSAGRRLVRDQHPRSAFRRWAGHSPPPLLYLGAAAVVSVSRQHASRKPADPQRVPRLLAMAPQARDESGGANLGLATHQQASVADAHAGSLVHWQALAWRWYGEAMEAVAAAMLLLLAGAYCWCWNKG